MKSQKWLNLNTSFQLVWRDADASNGFTMSEGWHDVGAGSR